MTPALAEAERDIAQTAVVRLAHKIAELTLRLSLGEQHGKLRRAAAPCKHGDPSWKAGAFFDERRMDNHSEGSVSPLPTPHMNMETEG